MPGKRESSSFSFYLKKKDVWLVVQKKSHTHTHRMERVFSTVHLGVRSARESPCCVAYDFSTRFFGNDGVSLPSVTCSPGLLGPHLTATGLSSSFSQPQVPLVVV